jgi:hypothetical protein
MTNSTMAASPAATRGLPEASPDRRAALGAEVIDLRERLDARHFALMCTRVEAAAVAAEAEAWARLAGLHGPVRRGHVRPVDGGRSS